MLGEIMRGKSKKDVEKRTLLFVLLSAILLTFLFFGLTVGSSGISIGESFLALFGNGTASAVRIAQRIRLPRVLAALASGAGLSLAGLILQTCLGNDMASPSTLGVSNAAVFGANVAIIGFAGEYLSSSQNVSDFMANANPFSTSFFAFIFALLSVFLVLGLSRISRFNPSTIILAGIGIGAIWTAATTILQYTATDVGLSAAVIWSFGDLGRATFTTDWIMLGATFVAAVIFILLSWRFNAMLSGDDVAQSLGVKTGVLRVFSLIIASMLIATIISFIGIIGFVGIIGPHVAKRLFWLNHRLSIPSSMLVGSILVLGADTLTRAFSGGMALPIGAVTSLLGAPFFLYLIFARKGARHG